MKILLIGCTGFIGKELIPKLIEEKNELFVISRKNINELNLDISLEKINFLKIDLSKEKSWTDQTDHRRRLSGPTPSRQDAPMVSGH